MKKFAWLVILACSIIFIWICGSQGGELGRVVGFTGFREDDLNASLINDYVRIDTHVEKDGSFVFPFVKPGRYLLVIGEGILIENEFEVLPDLTLKIDLSNSKHIRSKQMFVPAGGERVGGDRRNIYCKIALRNTPQIYPDKTFTGYVVWGDEETRSRIKPLNVLNQNLLKYHRLKGFVITP